jgi:small-conductance mechanosensitive channel
MIVPNGNMVTGVVKNFVRGDRVSRIKIPIQVMWGADPEKVREVLLDAARNHDEVQGIPAPAVLFSGFGANSLDFELVCFVEDVERAARVKSDLHYAIFKLFDEAGLRMNPGPSQTALTLDLAQLEPLMRVCSKGFSSEGVAGPRKENTGETIVADIKT